MHVQCPHCNHLFDTANSETGEVTCPSCGMSVSTSSADAPPTACDGQLVASVGISLGGSFAAVTSPGLHEAPTQQPKGPRHESAPAPPPPVASLDSAPDHLASTLDYHTASRDGAAATVGSMPHRLGDYELLEKLGTGGMGVVYRARQLSADRIVALKVIRPDRLEDLPPEKRQEWVDRFTTEARATARLEHDHIVTVYDVGQVDGVHFYSMRYVEGRSLKDLVREGPLENRRAAALMVPVARAVDHAHRSGILHRDLKPHNILVQVAEGEELRAEGQKKAAVQQDSNERFSAPALRSQPSALRPFVTDFGLAKWVTQGSHGLTHTGEIRGTPEYMSPEQATDFARVSAVSDVYSLGATLYDLLTGRPPFKAATPLDTLRQVVETDPVAPRELNPTIDRDLETITLKCLAKEPARRYARAAELADDLRRYLNGEPIVARPVSALERTWRWSRRHPGAASAMVAVLAAVVVLAVAVAVVSGKNQQLATANFKLDTTNDQLASTNTQLATSNEQLNKANEAERAAKQAAEGKQKEAEQARDETKQVLDSLVSFFRKPDPDADGETLTVAALLGQAVEQMDTTFPNQPLIQAPLLNAIGQTYEGLGLYQKAVEVHERARDLRRDELGEDREDTLTSMNNLAQAYRSAGRLEDALSLHEHTLELMKAKLGQEHPATLTSMNNLALAYQSAGRLGEALPLYEQTLELRKAKLGPEHPDTLTSMNNLAGAYKSAGRMAEALPLYEQTLELRKARLGRSTRPRSRR